LRLDAWNRSPEWLLSLGLGLPLLALASALLAPPTTTPRPKTSGRGLILCIAFIAALRAWPLITGWIPQGMVSEEHEAACGARELLDGKGPSLMFAFTTHVIALGLTVFGFNSLSVRWTSFLLSFGSCLLFWGMIRRYIANDLVLCAFVSFGVTAPLVASGLLLDEGFVPVVFLQCGILYGMARVCSEDDLWGFLVLGVFTGIAFYEYAPIKLGLFLAILTALFQAVRIAITRDGPTTVRMRRGILSLIMFVVACATTALPMILSLASGDGREFFDGRMEFMVGTKAVETISERIPLLAAGLKEHFRRVFVEDQGWPLLGPRRGPLVSWPLLVLPVLGLMRVAAKALQIAWPANGGGGRQRAVIGYAPQRVLTLTLACWAGVAFLYCSLWNRTDFHPHRLLCLFPLLVVLSWKAVERYLAAWPGALRWGVILSGTATWVSFQSIVAYQTFHDRSYRIEFRGKTESLCRRLETLNGSASVAILWDWTGAGFYFGDTPMDQWAAATAHNGYESWTCKRDYPLTPIGQPSRSSMAQLLGRFSHVVVAARYATHEEALSDAGESLLPLRLARYRWLLRKHVRLNHCQEFSSSPVYRYLLCEVRGKAG
jgi:hypothetical protein